MDVNISSLCSSAYRDAHALRKSLPYIATGLDSAELVRARLAKVAQKTACLTLLAGAGSRWVKSLMAARNVALQRGNTAATECSFPDDAPRGLYPVRNYIHDSAQEKIIPIAAYSIDALRGLGRHILVVRGWEKEIRDTILVPLGVDSVADFLTQEGDFRGKPAGHGDAAWQARALWQRYDYVIATFGGDANSPLTALSGLLALDALTAAGEEIDLLMPVALTKAPAYPVRIDAGGLPRSFGHNKLTGDLHNTAGTTSLLGPSLPDEYAYANVGIRIYRTAALYDAAAALREKYWRAESGYAIPGNDPEAREFALDNVDALFAAQGRARILAVASPEELMPAKSWDDIPAFERAVQSVRAEWDAWNSTAKVK